MPILPPLRCWPAALLDAARRFNRKNGWVMSSHIAMSMMLALFPFVLFTVALAGTVAGLLSQDVAMETMTEQVFSVWPDAVARPILTELKAVLQTSNTQLVTLGGLFALYFASNGVDAVRTAMVQAYHDTDTRPFWRSRALCIGLVVLGGAGILAVTVFEVILPLYVRHIAQFLPFESIPKGWEKGLRGVLALALPTGAVLAFHVLLPGRVHRLRRILPGAILTLLLWLACGSGFAFYVGSFAQYSATYAGLAGAMAAMIFLYLNSAILILGAEFNGALIEIANGMGRS
ncbi:YihY/virulence factor BrkB family protein [Leisingera sp. NJS204]|uniref:YihY/virulence factor BrkB family protein n=1 Tax=Leisingera sp. NJS204 TaxID=2508307 RepID=UPI0010112F1C|nr:YihY/virulence factor BrkB family protein [Leisingera sp. NJS204]QAX29653.1 YihY/virulence factor BrkB family protein [Leisingera sp. NJS204]